jgi:hypothetical protein
MWDRRHLFFFAIGFALSPMRQALGQTKGLTLSSGFLVPTGLSGDGRSDETTAIRTALTSGHPVLLPPGRFRISKGLKLVRGQVLAGAGARATSLVVKSDFDLSSGGVIEMAPGEPGAELHDFGISFDQPEGSDRSKLLAYPPAIVAAGSPRFRIDRLLIQRAMIGVDMRGNSGGATITDLQLSAFQKGILIDGSLDSIKMSRLHVWPFGLTPSQSKIYHDGEAVGVECGRCDDFHLDASLFFGLRKAMKFYKAEDGGTFGSIIGVDFDDRGGLLVEHANLRIQSCGFTIGQGPSQWIVAKSGSLAITGCSFFSGISLRQPGLEFAGGDIAITMDSCTFNSENADFVHLLARGPLMLTASDLIFTLKKGETYRSPLILLEDYSRAAFSNLLATDLNPGTGILVKSSLNSEFSLTGLGNPSWHNEVEGR